jgi:hypothetical protein
MTTVLLILHGLIGVVLLGALTHQTVSMFCGRTDRNDSFVSRYTGVRQQTFTLSVVSLYLVGVTLGAIVYPSYRLNVRIPFEEMSLGWAIGLFEIKEHFAGIGVGVLPLYANSWRAPLAQTHRRDRYVLTSLLSFIVWWDFLVGHVLNNIRGLA